MAQTLIWSREALEDIDSIAEYIRRDSLYHARQVVERLFELGDSQVRECFLYSYRLIYELKDEAIHILAVIHGKRLLESVGRFSS